MKKILNKKGNLGGIEGVPSVVLIVGLVFLVMATMALIGQKYGNALDDDNTPATVVNESVTSSPTAGMSITLASSLLENGACGAITEVLNGTGGVNIAVANFTQTDCAVVNSSSLALYGTTLLVSYPYTYSKQTVSSNVTGDLETEISNNTSIAGIVLTISLIGVVLTILISVFIGFIARRSSI